MSLLQNSLSNSLSKDITMTEQEFKDLLSTGSINTKDGNSIKISNPEPKKLYRVNRDETYDKLELSLIQRHCFHMDADVYEYISENPVTLKEIFPNKKHYKVNGNFSSANNLNEYLVLYGKIPSFLELKDSEGKGYGIFAKNDIMAGTFLGFYQGHVRPPFSNKTNKYLFECLDFDRKAVGQIDAENITFANFTRWINDGKEHNVDYIEHNFQVYAYSKKYIKKGDELIAPYGENYWKTYGKKID